MTDLSDVAESLVDFAKKKAQFCSTGYHLSHKKHFANLEGGGVFVIGADLRFAHLLEVPGEFNVIQEGRRHFTQAGDFSAHFSFFDDRSRTFS